MVPSRLSRNATTRDPRGFTLLELMFTLTVAAILLGIGVPSFIDFVRSNRATANINELSTAFAIARSEAIRRGANVTVHRSSDGENFGLDWADGWIVFVDNAASDTAVPPVLGQVLQVWGAMPGDAVVTTAPANVAWVRFTPRGGARSEAGMPLNLTVELAGCSGDQQRTLEINTVGRVTVTRGAC